MKKCNQCKTEKELSEFYKDQSNRNGLTKNCKECCKANSKNQRRIHKPHHPLYSRNSRLKNKYGITLEEYEKRLVGQDKKCMICKKVFEKNLCVDHDHVSGEVRGLLCVKCNFGLGSFDDVPQRLLRAAGYLESFQKNRGRVL